MPQGFFYLDAYSFPSKSEHLICFFLKAYLFQRPTYYNLNIWCLCKTRQVRDHCHTSRVWTAFNRTCCFIAHWTSPAVLLLHCFLHNKAFLQLTHSQHSFLQPQSAQSQQQRLSPYSPLFQIAYKNAEQCKPGPTGEQKPPVPLGFSVCSTSLLIFFHLHEAIPSSYTAPLSENLSKTGRRVANGEAHIHQPEYPLFLSKSQQSGEAFLPKIYTVSTTPYLNVSSNTIRFFLFPSI